MDNIQDSRGKNKRRWAVPVGAIILLLALIGVIAIVTAMIYGVSSAVDRARQEEFARYEELIHPLVFIDPAPFESVDQAANSDLIKAAYWAAQERWNQSEQQLEMTQEDGLVKYIMPSAEIQQESQRLFGIQVQMESFWIDGVLFEYDAQRDSILVPITSHIELYTPRVIAQKKKNDATFLTVEYISGMADADAPAVKVMQFQLSGEGEAMTISAVRNIT